MIAHSLSEAVAFAPPPPAKVGPNAIIQLADVLLDRHGEAGAHAVFRAAGLTRYLLQPPTRMTDESQAAALHHALWRIYPDDAPDLASEAGGRTADYLLAHRIPAGAQWLLRWLPAPVAARLLVKAIARHAWTFAGSGRFVAHFANDAGDAPLRIEIVGNPLATPGCHWHQAVFARLFTHLVSPHAKVRHTHCCTQGQAGCRFAIDWRR